MREHGIVPSFVLLRLLEDPRGADAVGGAVWQPAAPDAAMLPAAAVSAGSDGVFETIALVDGFLRGLPEHLARLAASAARCGVAALDADVWASGAARAADGLGPEGSFSITTMLHAGEPGSPPAAWIVGRASPDFESVRAGGVRVAVLDRGVLHDAPAPWLRLDAKTLSYAVARAAVRETQRRGADEVVFRSTDGFLLEGATASLLLRTGDVLQTPGRGAGVLAGTTVARLLGVGRARGLRTEAVPLPTDALVRADAAWLVSSVRRAVPITAVDGVPLGGDPVLGAAFDAALGGPAGA